MSADNMTYLQKCQDGKWRAWHGYPYSEARPSQGFVVEADTREAAVVAAFDWDKAHPTEYGVIELPDDSGPLPEPSIPLPFSPASPEQRLALIEWQRQIREAALEEAAKLCEAMRTRPPEDCADVERGFNAALRRAAAAIRQAKDA